MAIENLGVKLYSGTKSDRKSDSLGSAADGSNNGITINGLGNNEADDVAHFEESSGILNKIIGEKITSGNDLIGKTITKLGFKLYRMDSGTFSSSDTLTFGVWDNATGDLKTNGSFGTVRIDSLEYNSASNVSHCKEVSLTHSGSGVTIAENDIIGIRIDIDAANTKRVEVAQHDDATPDSYSNGGRCIFDQGDDNPTFDPDKDIWFNVYQGFLGSGAYYFDGLGSTKPRVEIDVGKIFAGATSEWTISLWLRGNFDYTSTEAIDNNIFLDISGSDCWQFFKHPTANWKLNFDGDSSVTDLTLTGGATAVPNDGKYHHICMTRNSSSLYTVYVDGVSKGSLTQTLNINSGNSQTLYLGSYAGYYDDEQWHGAIDDVGIWDRVLTATEISTLCGSTGSLDSDDFDNVYGSTQFARGFKVATSSSVLKDKKVKAVTFYVKKNGSATGTAYAKIYNGTTVVETNTTGTNLDVSTLSTSDYTAHKFEFTGNTTLDTGYSVVYYFDGGTGSAYTQIRREGSDVYDGVNTIYRKYHSSAWADDSGTDAKFLLEFADPQLVSSLSNKANLKAHYTMDTATEGYGNFDGNGDVVTFSSNGIMSGDFTMAMHFYYSSSQANNYPTFFQNGASGNDRIQITEQNNNKFQVYANNQVLISDDNIVADKWQHLALTGDGTSWKLYLDGTVIKTGTGTATRTDTSTKSFGGEPSGSYFTGGQRNFCIYNRALSASEITSLSNETKLPTDSSLNTSSSLKVYCPMWANFNDLSGNSVSMTVNGDASIITGFKCPNDFSSTSNLEALSGVRTNSIFQQTDDTPSYWWYNGTSWLRSLPASTYSDNFSSDDWSDQDSSKIGVSGGSLAFNSNPDGSNNASSLDLGSTLSDTKWTMRFEFKPTSKSISSGVNSHLFIGMSSSNSATDIDSNQEFLGGLFGGHATTNSAEGFASLYDDGSIKPHSASTPEDVAITWDTSATYYIEMKRSSATEFSIEIFSDSGYSTSIGKSSVTPSGVTGLQYVKVGNYITTNSDHITGTIDNLNIWDGIA